MIFRCFTDVGVEDANKQYRFILKRKSVEVTQQKY